MDVQIKTNYKIWLLISITNNVLLYEIKNNVKKHISNFFAAK